jgi:hypothetical protein
MNLFSWSEHGVQNAAACLKLIAVIVIIVVVVQVQSQIQKVVIIGFQVVSVISMPLL